MKPELLIGNQEGIEPKQYYYHSTGVKKAVLVHILTKNCCPSCWQSKENHFTDRLNVYKRL